MFIETGTKVHVVYRALYENSTRRHFVGEVTHAKGATVRLAGFALVMDINSRMFMRKPEKRETVIDLSESGYIVNIISRDVVLADIEYRYMKDVGLLATDNKDFRLDINEFGMKH